MTGAPKNIPPKRVSSAGPNSTTNSSGKKGPWSSIVSNNSNSSAVSKSTTANGAVSNALKEFADIDRLWFVMGNLVGLNVLIQTKNGTCYQGVFHSFVAKDRDGGGSFFLKMAKMVKAGDGECFPTKDVVSGNPYIPELIINMADIVKVQANKVDPSIVEKGTRERSNFMTDTDISGGSGAVLERKLQKWSPAEETNGDQLISMSDESHRVGEWDQFATNEKLFGVSTDYQEEIYTTKLDRNSEQYRKREREAQKIADEISKSSSSNVHLAEERGQEIDDGTMDEEDRYGAVVRGPSASNPAPPNRSKLPLTASNTNRGSYAAASAASPKVSSPVRRTGTTPSTGKPSIRQEALAKLEKHLISANNNNASVTNNAASASPNSGTGKEHRATSIAASSSQQEKVAKAYSEFSQQEKAKAVAEMKNFSQQLKIGTSDQKSSSASESPTFAATTLDRPPSQASQKSTSTRGGSEFKFNVKASEFKPNVNAPTFVPSGLTSRNTESTAASPAPSTTSSYYNSTEAHGSGGYQRRTKPYNQRTYVPVDSASFFADRKNIPDPAVTSIRKAWEQSLARQKEDVSHANANASSSISPLWSYGRVPYRYLFQSGGVGMVSGYPSPGGVVRMQSVGGYGPAGYVSGAGAGVSPGRMMMMIPNGSAPPDLDYNNVNVAISPSARPPIYYGNPGNPYYPPQGFYYQGGGGSGGGGPRPSYQQQQQQQQTFNEGSVDNGGGSGTNNPNEIQSQHNNNKINGHNDHAYDHQSSQSMYPNNNQRQSSRPYGGGGSGNQ